MQVSALCLTKPSCTIDPGKLPKAACRGTTFVVEVTCATGYGNATPAVMPSLPPTPPGPPPPPNTFGPPVHAAPGSWCGEAELHGLNYQNTWYLRCPGNATMGKITAHYGYLNGSLCGGNFTAKRFTVAKVSVVAF